MRLAYIKINRFKNLDSFSLDFDETSEEPVAGRRSNCRYTSSISRNWRPLVQFRGRMDGAHEGIVRCGCHLNPSARG